MYDSANYRKLAAADFQVFNKVLEEEYNHTFSQELFEKACANIHSRFKSKLQQSRYSLCLYCKEANLNDYYKFLIKFYNLEEHDNENI